MKALFREFRRGYKGVELFQNFSVINRRPDPTGEDVAGFLLVMARLIVAGYSPNFVAGLVENTSFIFVPPNSMACNLEPIVSTMVR